MKKNILCISRSVGRTNRKTLVCQGIICLFAAFTPLAFAANYGLITQIDAGGASDPNHVNVLQLSIAGGYDVAGCDGTLAAIRKTDTHLVAAAMAAYYAGKAVGVVLNPSDTYFPGRCVITRISAR